MIVSLILAAGSSSRMGSPKMLLPYRGKTMLRHIIDEAKGLTNNSLLVVTGCFHQLLAADLTQQNIDFVQNERWENGMGSSLSTGVNYILQHHPSAENILILTCDQPFVSTALFQQMIDAKRSSGKAIVACAYGHTLGIPVLFDKKYFSLLSSLKGNQGAKKIVSGELSEVCTINFAEGVTDIDEPEDYERLVKTE